VYRVLPLWLAGLMERILILLIPLLVVVFPLVRFLPAVYQYMVEHRIYRLYGELRALEAELERGGAGREQLAAVLDDLAARANRLSVPLAYSQRLFILKSHIAMARAGLEKRISPDLTAV
jgi:hypothetical protein